MIDLNSLRAIADEHGVELQISPHPSQTAIVLAVRKGDAVVDSKIDAISCSMNLENGVPVVEHLLIEMIERLEEFLNE